MEEPRPGTPTSIYEPIAPSSPRSISSISSLNPEESEKDVKSPNLIQRAKEEIQAIVHREKTHHKETHGTSDDIDEDTPVDYVKAPGVFERAKEEIEALIETIHPKKKHDDKQTPQN